MNEFKPVHLDKQTTDGAEMNIEALYQLFPSCFTEAKDAITGETRRVVDWSELRSLLSLGLANVLHNARQLHHVARLFALVRRKV